MQSHRFILPHSRSSGRNILICFFFFTLTGGGGFLGKKVLAFSSRKCFYCVWVALQPGEEKLVPSAINQRDVCLPGNFDSRNVHLETCQFDCVTLILYDYIETSRLHYSPFGRLPRGFLASRNSSFNEFDPKRTVVMTAFFRGCSSEPELKGQHVCHDYTEPNDTGVHVFQQKCFCSDSLCNDEIVPYIPSSAFTQLGAVATFWVLPLCNLLTCFV